ncbi:hypothetical protein [Streptomyces sp. NPDC002057]|uniref:hypothetical protein n=1 Tax=Streptomyces sp. NPDC002057 TaxID=3154664 RepID=UPI00333273EC
MDSVEFGRVPALFGSGTLVLAEPLRPVFRAWHGPKMHLLAADGTVLATLHETAGHRYVLRNLADRPVLTVHLVAGGGLARPRFQVSGADGSPIGEVRSPRRLSHARLLEAQAEGGGTLRATRSAPAGRTWLMTDQHDDVTARITVSTARSFDGLQRYRVEPVRIADEDQRALVVAVAVCLQVVRRWLAAPH